MLALRGSWWAPVLTIGLLLCIGWLWSRDSAAPDVLTVAAGELDKARTALRGIEGWDLFKKLYTKFSPDIGTLLPDLRRQAPLVTRSLLVGCGIAGGCVLVFFAIVKWLGRTKGRPLFLRMTSATGPVVAAVCFLALYAGPGVWALSPLWGTGGMLPAADASMLVRAIREREQQAEQRAQEAARVATVSMTAGSWAASPGMIATPVPLLVSDFAQFLRGAAPIRRPDFAPGGPGMRGGQPGPRNPAFAGGFRGPGQPPRDNERSRQERQKLAAFLKANDHGERWLLAVSGHQQASSYIIEDGISVMPIRGFGGGTPTLGADPEETKARLTKLVEEGQVRFFEVGGGRSGFPGGNRRPTGGFGPRGRAAGGGAPPGGAPPGGGPPPGFGRRRQPMGSGTSGERQCQEGRSQLVYGKRAHRVRPRRQAARPGFGMMAPGELYDLRPELGLREP